MSQLWKRCTRCALSALACLGIVAAIAGCAQQDTRTVVTVWSWEPSMSAVARSFEAANPDVRIDIKDTSGYDNLNSAIQDGYGLPDVVQLEYYALPQYAVSEQLLDLTDRVDGYEGDYTPGTWSSVQLNNRVYGVPMDSGPMAFFYNQYVFEEAGIDATQIRTWDDYYMAAKKLKQIGVYIAADSGDASFYNAMIWLAGGRPYSTSQDGRTVNVDFTNDVGTRTFTSFWQKMIDEGLVDTHLTTWSDQWQEALGAGKVASVFSGAWFPSLLLADVPGTAGLWRVSQMPTVNGSTAGAEMGGSALGVLQSSRKPDAAFRFVEYACHDPDGIRIRVAGGAFPADTASLNADNFLSRTTIRDARGIDIPYFGGQEFNEVFSAAAERVSVGYQYLPFEVYARSDFRSTMGQAYSWSRQRQALDEAQERKAAGFKDVQLPENPGVKVALSQGLELWQKDLKEYAINQGFTVQ
ncbi:MAG: sugar ABC transporter substrate-binding protein [Bifidobacterium tsurumiense]|uniref:ABC transporter substrate-binding protein n=1 Tax=Bifidobacterium tsurumiense TaxID=356829 RepID=UPI002A7FE02C|nr:sugar ABC transporter substrate-binding protein [Bifidobacterium tsurumiense]MDY4677360.1 sugar ABC transporter substrate-binding protein [Bifidobacterium tsurumiense]